MPAIIRILGRPANRPLIRVFPLSSSQQNTERTSNTRQKRLVAQGLGVSVPLSISFCPVARRAPPSRNFILTGRRSRSDRSQFSADRSSATWQFAATIIQPRTRGTHPAKCPPIRVFQQLLNKASELEDIGVLHQITFRWFHFNTLPTARHSAD